MTKRGGNETATGGEATEARAETTATLDRCPRCGGNLYDEDPEPDGRAWRKCYACSRSFTADKVSTEDEEERPVYAVLVCQICSAHFPQHYPGRAPTSCSDECRREAVRRQTRKRYWKRRGVAT